MDVSCCGGVSFARAVKEVAEQWEDADRFWRAAERAHLRVEQRPDWLKAPKLEWKRKHCGNQTETEKAPQDS